MTHPVFGDIETLGPWTAHIQTMDLSLAEGNPDASVRAWRLAYSAALSDRGWRGLLAVATASIRLRALPGLAGEAVARARETYWIAFFRARQQSSLDGVLSAAAAFKSLGDCAAFEQSLRVADDGEAAAHANAILRYAIGCMHQFGKSGFAKKPTESFATQRKYLLA